MRILFFSLSYPTPWQPTAAVFNRTMLEALCQQHEVQALVPVPWPQRLRGRRGATGQAPSLPRAELIETRHCSYFYPPGLLRQHHDAFMWISSRRELRRMTARFAPDVFLAYWTHPDGAVALRAAREASRPCVVIVGGSDVLVIARDDVRRRAIERVLRGADALLTVGEALRERVVALGAAPGQAEVLRRGVNPALFHPGDRSVARARLGLPTHAPFALWVGRMAPVKGLPYLIAAGRRLAASEARLYLVGDGPQRNQLQALVRRLDLEERVCFAGARAQDELGDWYRAADLTVLPSRSEGIPNVLLESLACGTPFLATDVGGVREICAAPERDLVPAGDADALARALDRRLRAPGAAVVPPGFSQTDSAAAITKVLQAAIERRARRPPQPAC